ncbi:MAG: hypothetical protein IT447_04920 [Phycisphaerales bacterium]|jgi:hypothetical protein|nr:hypothetical protein [Phycisphaerales bacterium]
MRLVMDVDYQDLCLSGYGDRESLRRLFAQAKDAGFEAMLFAPMVCGKAIYPSKVAGTMHKPSRTHRGSERIAQLMREFDVLDVVAKLAAEFDLKLMLYFRLLDDYFPELSEEFMEQHPQWWWQSRCGFYPLRGWPCYHYPQVREYKLRLLKEQLDYGFDEILFDLARSHSFYASPHREPDFFGFNEPIAEAFAARTGVDIRAYDHKKFLTVDQGVYKRIPFVYSVEYINAAQFDRSLWHWIKGEGFEAFLREARGLSGKRPTIALGAFTPPHPVAIEEIAPATFYLDANRLAAEGVIDGCLQSANWSSQKLTADLKSFMFPYYNGVRQEGKQVGAWLNDIFSPHGGEPSQFASVEQVKAYWHQHVVNSGMDFVVIHEADFILRHPNVATLWNTIASCPR